MSISFTRRRSAHPGPPVPRDVLHAGLSAGEPEQRAGGRVRTSAAAATSASTTSPAGTLVFRIAQANRRPSSASGAARRA